MSQAKRTESVTQRECWVNEATRRKMSNLQRPSAAGAHHFLRARQQARLRLMGTAHQYFSGANEDGEQRRSWRVKVMHAKTGTLESRLATLSRARRIKQSGDRLCPSWEFFLGACASFEQCDVWRTNGRGLIRVLPFWSSCPRERSWHFGSGISTSRNHCGIRGSK